jgi:hypothetical protein
MQLFMVPVANKSSVQKVSHGIDAPTCLGHQHLSKQGDEDQVQSLAERLVGEYLKKKN